ncbi:MAG TPA: VWA domain-containing protein [Terracidiphilus sp.]|nr:VWA domain-containing protein [Terracidiphilus sp.]
MLCFRNLAPALLAILVVAITPSSAVAQADNNQPIQAPVSPLQINVRNVLVDVVVTDKKGAAVPNLHKEDFEVLENGKPQAIEYFEPHFPSASAPAQPAPPLPPNTFTNVPAAEPNQAINLLLMDALNTTTQDQAFARQRIVKYLGTIPRGLRIGVFLLGDRLRIIQGFTDDSTLLRTSVERLAGNPVAVAMEATPNELASQSTSMNNLYSMAADPGGPGANGGAQLAEMIGHLQDFLATSTAEQQNQQLLITLDALQAIAHYVSAIPGRKNLIWFVGSFPLCFPGITTSNINCPYEDQIKKTVDALAAARVSVYPISTGGVAAPNADMGSITGSSSNGSSPLQAAMKNSGQDSGAFELIASDTWAEQTGGVATHHNDLKGGLAEAIQNGSSYYTVAYTPTDSKEIGRERKIAIHLKEEGYKLSYRRNYFERTAGEIKTNASKPMTDPLRPLMDRGMPSFSDLHFRLHVHPDTAPPTPGTPPNGDNAALQPPFRHYTVRFFLSPQNLNLIESADGTRRAPVEVALIVYSQRGESLNWLVRSVNLAIRADQWAFAESNGIPFHFDFDMPPGDVYLRAGIYDASTERAGTLEVPAAAIHAASK